MPKREQKQKPAPQRKAEEPTSSDSPAKTSDRQDRLAELDGLLDEIDEVLETNAEEFVRSYVQKGGQ